MPDPIRRDSARGAGSHRTDSLAAIHPPLGVRSAKQPAPSFRTGGRGPAKLRVIGAAAAALLGLMVAGCSGGGSSDPSADSAPPSVVQVSTATAVRKDLQSTIAVTGTVAPLPGREAKVAPLAAGRLATADVRPGDSVSRGQIIATLEPGALNGQIQAGRATVSADEATVQQAKLALRAQRADQQAAVLQAEAGLRASQVALDKTLAGSRPQEIAQGQATVTAAQAALTSADQSLSRAQTLSSEGLLARKDLEAAQAQKQTAEAQLQSAKEALSLLKAGSRPQDIEAARLDVSRAQDQLAAARAQSVQNEVKAQDVQIAQRQLAAAQGALNSLLAQRASLRIRAPLSGTVVGAVMNPGEAVDTTSTIADIVDLTRVLLLLNVPAAEIPRVRVGNPVVFTPDSAPTVQRTAAITRVGRAADMASNTVQVVAETANLDGALQDDAYVHARIVTSVHRSVLVVPAASIVELKGRPTVFVVGSDDVVHARQVMTGLMENHQTEILSGLTPGDRVVTTGAYELEDGVKVHPGS